MGGRGGWGECQPPYCSARVSLDLLPDDSFTHALKPAGSPLVASVGDLHPHTDNLEQMCFHGQQEGPPV